MTLRTLLLAAAAASALPGAANAERLFGLTGSTIVTFDSTAPATITNSGAITGIAGGDTLLGLDLRPSNNTLYSIGTSGNIYAIAKNASGTGYTASFVTATTAPSGTRFGVDFNPVPDRLRVVSDTDQNLRINVASGATTNDAAINYAAGDAQFGTNPNLVGVAYTNSRSGMITATMLYGIDAGLNSLVRSTVPNAGTYVTTNLGGGTFAPLGFTIGANDAISFDISGGTGAAFLSNGNALYSVSLTSGAATSIGTVAGAPLSGLTVGSVPEPATWALMIGGFGLVGASVRRQRAAAVAA